MTGLADRIRNYLLEKGLDALIISSPINFTYASGCCISTQKTIPSRTAYVIFSIESDPVLVACATEQSYVRKASKIHDMRFYVEHYQDPTDLVAGVLKERTKQHSKRVGIEEDFFTLNHFSGLKRALPGTIFEPIDTFFAECRAIKTEREIEILRTAAQSTARVIETTFSHIQEGMTELDLAERLAGGIMKEGADNVAFIALSSGTNRFIMHHYPENKPVTKGELVHTDFGAIWRGYYSDLVRMASIGEPTEDELFKSRAVYKAHRAVIEKMKPGVPVADLYRICKKTLESEGLQFDIPHIGHSVGLELHEEPVISMFCKHVLKENMVFCIEPGLLSKTDFYHIEDMVVVEKDGARFLSTEIPIDEFPIVNSYI